MRAPWYDGELSGYAPLRSGSTGLQPRERQVRARETQARFIRAIGRRDESRLYEGGGRLRYDLYNIKKEFEQYD